MHVDRGRAHEHGIGTRGVGTTDDGARVAGVAHVGEQHEEARAGIQHGAQVGGGGVDDGEHPLGGVGLGHGGEHLGRHLVHVQPGGAGGIDDVGGVAGEGLGGDVDVAHARRGIPHGLAHALGSLDGEAAGALTHRPLRQRPHRPHPVGPGVGQHRQLVQAEALAGSRAGWFALEISTSAVNAASSLTASSASMRRSTSISAAFRPWMNRL